MLIKKMLCAAVMAMLFSAAFAQVSVDPNDEFYSSAKEWQVRGIVPFLPQIAPYPVSTIKQILETVKENGRDVDIELADYYYKKYFGKQWNAGFEIGDKGRFSDTGNKFKTSVFAEPSFFGDAVFFDDFVSLGYEFGALFNNKNTETKEVLPLYFNVMDDTYDDPATFGKIVGNLEMITNLAVGKSNLYGMMGVNRLGYGPFDGDSVILNPSAYHSGNFLFSYDNGIVSYSQSVSAISASRNDGTGGAVNNKFLAFHSICFTPVKQLSIAYYEASVYGRRFDPCYFIPVPYMAIQGMFSECDNTLSGLQFEVRPVDRLELALSGAIDDINTNDFAKGELDARLKLALQTGIFYTPKSDFCNMISFDYTLVTPYTYSHEPNEYSAEVTHNYDNYTNRNTCVGSSILPNSDRFRVNVKFTPVKRLKLNLFTSFVAHANELDSLSVKEAVALVTALQNKKAGSTDGSAWTSAVPKEIQEKNNFLNQGHYMHVLQAGFDASYEIPRQKWGVLRFNLGYTFEYIHNKGVDEALYSSSDLATEEGIKAARKSWMDKFHDEYNNYFTVSAKYTY